MKKKILGITFVLLIMLSIVVFRQEIEIKYTMNANAEPKPDLEYEWNDYQNNIKR